MTEAITEAVATDLPVVLPFGDLSREDQIQHLKDYHDFDATASLGSKVTKERMESYHEGFHVGAQGVRRVDIEHEHRGLSAEDFAGASDLVKALEKPLSVAERNALKQLVDNDFDSLSKEIDAQAAVVLNARLGEATAAFAVKRQEVDKVNEALVQAKETARKALVQALDEYEATFATIKEDAERKGVSVRGGGTERYYTTDRAFSGWTAEVQGEAAEQDKIKTEVRREQQAAKIAADRQRLSVNRQIMLAAIPEAIRPLVTEIPTAKVLYAQAAENKQIEA